MHSEEEKYWEGKYVDFEKQFCRDHVFWRAPIHVLRDTPLFALFEQFIELFPDHPSDRNTVFYLLGKHLTFDVSPPSFSILFSCSHFEHGSLDDIQALAVFLQNAAATISPNRTPSVELLDRYSEELHVCFHDPTNEIVTLLQKQPVQNAG
jgi:hypothetical protein